MSASQGGEVLCVVLETWAQILHSPRLGRFNAYDREGLAYRSKWDSFPTFQNKK